MHIPERVILEFVPESPSTHRVRLYDAGLPEQPLILNVLRLSLNAHPMSFALTVSYGANFHTYQDYQPTQEITYAACDVDVRLAAPEEPDDDVPEENVCTYPQPSSRPSNAVGDSGTTPA